MTARRAPGAARGDAQWPARFRALAATVPALQAGLDRDAYAGAQLDALEPVIGFGPVDAPVCFFGRDPGREELRLRQPFVGDAGRLLRRGLLPSQERTDASDEDLLRAGERFFWLNIVPYKPRGNAVWPAAVRNAFRPLVLECLLARWQGDVVVTLGQHAFEWFAAGQRPEVRQAFQARWARVLEPDVAPVSVRLKSADAERVLRVYPLPHPSPANVIGRRAFPALLDANLRELGCQGSPAGSP
jgi:uracil-DNA glycosylase